MFTNSPYVGPREELSLVVYQGAGSLAGMIASKVLPKMPVTKRSAHLLKLDAANTQARRSIANQKFLREPGAVYERVKAKVSDDNLTVNLRGVEMPLPVEYLKDLEGYYNLMELFSNRFGKETATITDEVLTASALFNTTNFGSATNSAQPYILANEAVNSFFGDIIAACRRGKAKGEWYDTVIIPGPVYDVLRQSTGLLKYLKGPFVGIQEINVDIIQQALAKEGIKQVLIADQYENTGSEGMLSDTLIWSTAYVWVGTAGKVGGVDPEVADGVDVPQLAGIGCMTIWEGYDANGLPTADQEEFHFDGGYFVEVYPSKETDSEILRLKMSSTPYLGNTRAGELIATQANY